MFKYAVSHSCLALLHSQFVNLTSNKTHSSIKSAYTHICVCTSHYSSSPERRCCCWLGINLGPLFMLHTLHTYIYYAVLVCMCAYEWDAQWTSNVCLCAHINSTVNVRNRERGKKHEKQRNKYIEYRTICAHNSFIFSGFFPFNLLFCFLGPRQLNSNAERAREWIRLDTMFVRTLFFLAALLYNIL